MSFYTYLYIYEKKKYNFFLKKIIKNGFIGRFKTAAFEC